MLTFEVLTLIKEFLAEGPYNSLQVNEEYLTELINRFLVEEDKYVGWVRNDEEEMVGILIACLLRNPITADKQCSELVLFVRPEYRKNRVASSLIENFEWWAKECGARYAGLTLHNNKYHDALTRFYQSMGYNKVEETFVKELI